MKASNNEFPSLLLDEQASAPATPGTGLHRVYFKSDGLLYEKDDAGVETSIGNGEGADVSDGDKGDITVSEGGSAWTIDNDAVTFAKIQNLSGPDVVLGRQTNGVGNVEELPCTQFGRDLIAAGNYSDGREVLGLVIGSHVQAFDPDLAALSALTGTDTIYYRSAADTWSAVTIGSGLAFSGGELSASGGGGDSQDNLLLPATDADNGQIKWDGQIAIHTFGTSNFFAGFGAGNLTLSGTQNVGIGSSALLAATSGNANTAVGTNALTNKTSGSDNTGVGGGALSAVTTGGQNTAIGQSSGNSITSGSSNTFVGYNADATSGDLTNITAIGNGALVSASDTVAIGNVDVGVIVGGTAAIASACLALTSTSRGFLPPRMTTSQRLAIANPDNGLIVYDTSIGVLYGYQNGLWASLGGGGSSLGGIDITLTGGDTATVDWSTKNFANISLTGMMASYTVSFSNVAKYKSVLVVLNSPDGMPSITWDAQIAWKNNTPPGAAGAVALLLRFTARADDVVFGEYFGNWPIF